MATNSYPTGEAKVKTFNMVGKIVISGVERQIVLVAEQRQTPMMDEVMTTSTHSEGNKLVRKETLERKAYHLTEVGFGMAICNPQEDSYNEALGLQIATNRAYHKKSSLGIVQTKSKALGYSVVRLLLENKMKKIQERPEHYLVLGK